MAKTATRIDRGGSVVKDSTRPGCRRAVVVAVAIRRGSRPAVDPYETGDFRYASGGTTVDSRSNLIASGTTATTRTRMSGDDRWRLQRRELQLRGRRRGGRRAAPGRRCTESVPRAGRRRRSVAGSTTPSGGDRDDSDSRWSPDGERRRPDHMRPRRRAEAVDQRVRRWRHPTKNSLLRGL